MSDDPDREEVLRVIALALAVWRLQAMPGSESDAVPLGGIFLKFLKGEPSV